MPLPQLFKMMRILLVCAVIIATVVGLPRAGRRLPRLDGRIVGGEPVEIEDYPYQVSLQINNFHFCGGSIALEYAILTAAHCTDGITTDGFAISYGSKHRYQGESVDVGAFEQDEQFNYLTLDHDMALLILTSKMKLGSNAAIIPMITDPQNSEDRIAYASGWGALSSGGGSPDYLQAVAVTEVPRDKCNDAYNGAITSTMICFADEGKDSCQGDSGGPLVDRNANVQIGIVSWGYGCADPKYPGVYTHIYGLLGLYNRQMAKLKSK
ncbi:hypothetical protein FQA39_LY16119 [Lamprigera yunnana]|nr:hypothetical protein FQA39_LY16119 [Lamprigera yunnana]